jgi:hypothetical protein
VKPKHDILSIFPTEEVHASLILSEPIFQAKLYQIREYHRPLEGNWHVPLRGSQLKGLEGLVRGG